MHMTMYSTAMGEDGVCISSQIRHRLQLALGCLALVMVCALSLRTAWTGFVVSDDAYYVEAGLGWLRQFPYVAPHFGNSRFSVALPIASMVFLFGESELSITLSTALFLVATTVCLFFMLIRLIGQPAAFAAAVALATTPLFALKATIPGADIAELFFVSCSFWLFWLACTRNARTTLLLASGISAGLAFSAHELSCALVLFYGVLFLTAYRIRRRDYLWLAFGFLLVIALEAGYYALSTGNPAYRFALLMKAAAVHDRLEVGFLEIAAGGTLHVWAPIDPVVMLLTHHDFGLLGWIALPAVGWLLAMPWRDQSPPVALARLMLGLGVSWYLVSALLLSRMVLLPRYYMVTAYCLVVVSAIWLSVGLWPRRKPAVIALLAVALSANLLGVSVDNRNPKYAERTLVDYLRDTSGPVYTDPLTAHNVSWYCRWEGVDCARIRVGSPDDGAAYFWNPRNAASPNRFVSRDELERYQPKPSWELFSTVDEAPRPLVTLLAALGLESLVPAALWRRLRFPNPTVYFYRVRD